MKNAQYLVVGGQILSIRFFPRAPLLDGYGPGSFMSFDPASVDTSALKARVAELRRFL